MTKQNVGLGAGSVALLVGGWGLDAFVDPGSPLAVLLICAGVGACLLWFMSSQRSDRMFWRPIAARLEPHLSSAATPSADTRSARIAGNRVLAELRDIGMRLKGWIDQGPAWWAQGGGLPDHEWHQLRDEIAGDPELSKVWNWVSRAYTLIDAINRTQGRLKAEDEDPPIAYDVPAEFDLEETPGGDDAQLFELRQARSAVGRAQRELSRALERLA